MSNRLFVKITRDNLPQVKDKYPYLYLERGRLEVDDSSVKWIDCDCNVVRIPCATIKALLLGPGTSITHEAVKVLAASNCCVSWVGEDSLIFYAVGQSPTSDSRNMRTQMMLSADPKKALNVARRMFVKRFPDMDLSGKNLKEMMAMEGRRIKELYEKMAGKYGVGWKGRSYEPGKFEMGDTTNQYLTSANAALYGILSASIYSMGYSPHIGFIHSGSPLPFIYDVADLYKEQLCIDTAFVLTVESAGTYSREKISEEFRKRVIESDLLGRIGPDIKSVLLGE
jgi:CRISPR-associated protein Cas1